MPLAALGLPPPGQPVAVAILTVGSQDFSGVGRVGGRPEGLFGGASIRGFAAGGERKRQRSETDAEQDWVAHDGSLEIARYNAAGLSLFTAFAMNFV